MTNLIIKKHYDDAEIPKQTNNVRIDFKIHSFHKINDYDGIVPHPTETYLMQGCTRVLVKMGYSIQITNPNYGLQIVTRKECAIIHGITVLDSPSLWLSSTNELEIVLYCSSYDRVTLLKKGYRIAQGILVPIENMSIQERLS